MPWGTPGRVVIPAEMGDKTLHSSLYREIKGKGQVPSQKKNKRMKIKGGCS